MNISLNSFVEDTVVAVGERIVAAEVLVRVGESGKCFLVVVQLVDGLLVKFEAHKSYLTNNSLNFELNT